MSEFDFIKRYFSTLGAQRPEVVLGVGDDAAIITQDADRQLVVAVDTLVCGVHFPESTSPEDIGHKALAVNLSDLAAMSAEPAWATLALTLPNSDEAWIKRFSQGFGALASKYNVQLIGGDTTRGPLTITVQVAGYVPVHQALTRSGARAGDSLFVSGTLGDAGLGLRAAQHGFGEDSEAALFALQKLNRPEPRIALGIALRNIASAAIDISDGLAADLTHVLDMSNVGARIFVDQLPLSSAMRSLVENNEAQQLALTAGDDYELCFTVPQKNLEAFSQIRNRHSLACTEIGIVEAQTGLRIIDRDNNIVKLGRYGYDHFSV